MTSMTAPRRSAKITPSAGRRTFRAILLQSTVGARRVRGASFPDVKIDSSSSISIILAETDKDNYDPHALFCNSRAISRRPSCLQVNSFLSNEKKDCTGLVTWNLAAGLPTEMY